MTIFFFSKLTEDNYIEILIFTFPLYCYPVATDFSKYY